MVLGLVMIGPVYVVGSYADPEICAGVYHHVWIGLYLKTFGLVKCFQ